VSAPTEPTVSDPPVAKARNQAREAYAQESDKARQDQRILDYLPLVRHIVQKVTASLKQRIDTEDLISAGTIGLVRAARAYRPDKHAEFKTYAYIRVRGAVIDELRSRSFASTKVHRRIRTIREAYQALFAETGAVPDDAQIAARAGLSLQSYYRTVEEARRQHFLSIHGMDEESPCLANLIPAESASPETEAQKREMVRRLTEAIRELPERDRHVILLYYQRDLTMKEVAETLGVTESRVSQVHAGALFRLSMKLQEDAS
jgi:RNA polymerase sigma factor for flagellar operon FliA